MGERDHVSKAEYRGIVKEMQQDIQRSGRKREVERAHGQDLPSLLNTLYRKHDGNASAVLRDLNQQLTDSRISRPTLYNWLDEYEVRDS